jgi:type IVB pilus formation R64 PilN family outer membrane protein
MSLNRFILLWLVILLNGCTAFYHARKNSEQINENQQESDRLLKELQQSQRQQTRVHSQPWVSKKAIKIMADRIPQAVNCDITFATGTPMALNEFSTLMNKLCGLPVRITPDAEEKLSRMSWDKNDQRSESKKENSEAQKIDGIRWEGKLDGLLDVVAASLGLSWKYSDGEINLYYLDSRTFYIYAIPSETEMKSVVQSGVDAGLKGDSQVGGESSDGKSSQTTSISLKSSMVQDIGKSIESMLTPGFGRLSASRATGTITVTDTPEVLNRIERYIDAENRSITKQVLLNVKVITVALNDRNQFDINWNLIYQTKRLGAAFKGPMSGIEAGAGLNTTVNILDGHFNTSSLLLDALATQGEVSLITSPSVTTLNLQPVPVQVATETSYLARVENNSTSGVGQTSSLIPGTVTSGFNMNLLPFVMPDNQLLLQYSINLSELKNIKSISSGDNQIQIPEIDNRIFSQKVRLKSGQTLVLSGFEQTNTTSNRKGTGMASNWLLGGGVSTENKRNIIVIMITPLVME